GTGIWCFRSGPCNRVGPLDMGNRVCAITLDRRSSLFFGWLCLSSAREDSLGTSVAAERADGSPRVVRCWLSSAFHNSSAMEAHGLESTRKPSPFRCGAGGPGQYCPGGDRKPANLLRRPHRKPPGAGELRKADRCRAASLGGPRGCHGRGDHRADNSGTSKFPEIDYDQN